MRGLGKDARWMDGDGIVKVLLGGCTTTSGTARYKKMVLTAHLDSHCEPLGNLVAT